MWHGNTRCATHMTPWHIYHEDKVTRGHRGHLLVVLTSRQICRPLRSGINKILSSVLRINKMAIGLALLCRSCPNPEGFECLIPGLPLLYLCCIVAIIWFLIAFVDWNLIVLHWYLIDDMAVTELAGGDLFFVSHIFIPRVLLHFPIWLLGPLYGWTRPTVEICIKLALVASVVLPRVT